MGQPHDLEGTVPLALSPLFQPQYAAAHSETLALSYERARAICRHHGDIMYLSKKFWALHLDYLMLQDLTAYTLVTIQYNLAAGTLAPFVQNNPPLEDLMQKILNFDVSAQFLLTELGHGLDAKNLETTATLQPDGSFILHTPTPAAAKYMPPTIPIANIPRIGVVMANLVVEGENRGIRPFVVTLNDGKRMCKGVTSTLLPTVHVCKSVDHALTSFNQVSLPRGAMLGNLERPENMRVHFLRQISRVSVGTLSLSLTILPALRLATYIAGKYSIRRVVTGPANQPIPIIDFRTQQIPILHALAQITVMQPFASETIASFLNPKSPPQVKHAFATILKAVFLQHGQRSYSSLIERCGAQGLFAHNQLCEIEAHMRSSSISEGDILVLSIRLANELLLGRYSLPRPRFPTSLLAQHEAGLIAECLEMTKRVSCDHRSKEYNNAILPRCRPIVEAIGHRMAYEAALSSNVDADLLSLYEVGVIQLDPGWYIENGLLSRRQVGEMEQHALDAVLPRLGEYLDYLEAEPYCSAPMLSSSAWEAFVGKLGVYRGESEYQVLAAGSPTLA
ncbi:hypothetical protein FE257_001428 [Aspergillus nanangensis]|uniref:Acyl-CoA oxidase C-alpha1 domain-containing protein n=1 Tax=Aspergillus nanangensis TaxID=2582783 RepID=A0AAD4GPM5_ASPNN|nr:hypothetical protein FE257_001428 [Aspergillus nanangensis]